MNLYSVNEYMKKSRIIAVFTLAMLLLATVGEAVAHTVFPAYFSGVQLSVPLFFWLFYATVLSAVDISSLGKNFPKIFLAVKGAKIFLSLLLLFLLSFIFREQAVGIILLFLFYYTALTIAESIFIIYTKKRLGKK